MVKAFVFDLGNTLIEYPLPEKLRENCARSLQDMRVDATLLDRMHELYLEDRRASFDDLHEATIERALTRALREIGREFDDAMVLSLMEEIYHFGFRKYAALIEGAPQLMAALKERELKTGIVSNTPFPGSFFKRDLEGFGLLQYFQTLVWSSEFGKRKPSPDIFKKALHDLRVEPAEAVFVGDSFGRDVLGSSRVGMQSVWFDRKGRGRDYDGHRVSSLIEILSLKELFS